MLTVNVKFVAKELAPGIESGEYSVEDGSTVRELIVLCADRCGVPAPSEKSFELMYSLFDGKPATLDGALTKDGTLHVCRVVMGG